MTTALAGPEGLSIVNNQLVVSNATGNSITVYPVTASGDVAPTRQLTGAATLLGFPDQKAVLRNFLYVTNGQARAVLVFNLTDTGNVAPTRTLMGALTGFSNPLGMVIF
jgi:hypothetical protein